MAELHPDNASQVARSAIGYAQAFDGKGIDWHDDAPWPHRMELAQALDWITELGAMVLNLAERVERLTAERDTLSRKLKLAEIKLRDSAHPASEPRDPPESLATLGFWPDCGCGECYAIHCLSEALGERNALQAKLYATEPVAWMFDRATWCEGDLRGRGWHPDISRSKPYGSGMVRNVAPLYAAPPDFAALQAKLDAAEPIA